MAASILDGVTGLFTPDVVHKAASVLGESDAAISKGVGAAIPALLGGVASRADDPGFASSLFELVKSPLNDGGVLKDVGSLFGASGSSPMMSLGNKLLGTLFGGGTSNVSSNLAGYAGVKSSSAMTLLNVAAPLVLAFLGKRARTEATSPTALAGMLRDEKDSIAAAVPGPLASAAAAPETPAMATEMYRTRPAVQKRSALRWLLPAAAAVIALALILPMFGRKETAVTSVMTPDVVEPAPATSVPAAALPSGTVYFDSNQSAMPADGDAALAPVIEYLRANPDAIAVVSGYHDPSGDLVTNDELARGRAESVLSAIAAAGIDRSRIELQKPVMTEGVEEARRVEVTVRQ
jgi:OOP family OmpA-OmpF porin